MKGGSLTVFVLTSLRDEGTHEATPGTERVIARTPMT
jgi:hypothetical protein